jgi:hypothetical protein
MYAWQGCPSHLEKCDHKSSDRELRQSQMDW